ncbi:MAG: orotidine 5'-phosphate decarboxylase [Promethearchaeota archaeon]
MSFSKLLVDSKEDSRSNICVGLDFATYGSRKEKTLQQNEDKTEVILKLIDKLSPFCCSFKVNRQYILDLSLSEIQMITAKVHEYSRPIIIDHKVSDIGTSNDQALFRFKNEGFDAFTASPFPGNVKQICDLAHSYKLSSIILVLMSNPEAEWMKKCIMNGIPLFQHFARLTEKFADGAVVGATGHVGVEELRIIAEEISGKVILSPGIGVQRGEIEKLLTIFRDDVIFNIGRAIIYHQNPVETLKKFNNSVRLICNSLGM